MALIIAIDMIVVAVLVGVVLAKGFEAVLPVFAFIVIVVPTESVLPMPGLFDLTTQRVATIALAALYLAFETRNANEPEGQATPLKYLLLAYIGWSMISTLNSIVFVISLKTVLSNIFDFCLVYYIFIKTITGTESVHKILRAFVAALTACCVFGWFEAYHHWRVISLFPDMTYRFSNQGYEEDLSRICSSFPHSILFGNALALGIPWALYLLTKAKSAAQKTYLWIAVMLMFWNIYKTMARGPWLGLILSAALLFLFSEGKIRKSLVAISLLCISVCVIRPGVWDSIKNTYLETLNPDDPRGGSYQYRYDLMDAARQRLAKDSARAIWGFGPESFYYADVEGLDSTTGKTFHFESCDSAMVDVMVDTGYVGLLVVAALLLKPAWVSLRGFTRLPKPTNSFCLVLLINLVAFLFMMLSVMNWGWGQQSYMVWVIFALAFAYPRLAAMVSHGGADSVRGECEPVAWLPEVSAPLPKVTVG